MVLIRAGRWWSGGAARGVTWCALAGVLALAPCGSVRALAQALPTPAGAPTQSEDAGAVLAAAVGLPPKIQPFVGPYGGFAGAAGAGALLGGGVYRDLKNPALGVLGVQVEAYVGTAARRSGPQGSLALGLRSPFLRLGSGLDVDYPQGEVAPFLSIMHPLRRGGLLMRGGLLHLTWLFGGAQRLRVGVTVPVSRRLAGADRPRSDHVELGRARPAEPPAPPAGDPLVPAVAELRDGALRVGQVVVPDLGRAGSGHDPTRDAVADSLKALARLLAGTGREGALAVVRDYHATLERAFSVALDPGAAGVTPQGRALADAARAVMLEHVLLPLDRLVGQKRKPLTLAPFAAAALAAFEARAGVAARPAGVPAAVPAPTGGAAGAPPPAARAAWVLSQLLAAMDELVARERWRFEDTRLVWLPLQLALREEDHETQEQIDALIERATGREFTDSNAVAYVHSAQFQLELYRSIHAARSYHVLWVHEFRGVNQAGTPDRVAYQQVTHGYLAALIERVRAYDVEGALPEFHIFIDDYYFEKHGSRLWLAFLQDPLEHRLRLRRAPAGWQATIDSLQTTLRSAVAGSRRLQAEARQHGQRWLRDRVSVHVHVTGQPDPAYWSADILPLLGISDNLLRDHRKLVFYDLTEADPYRGLLIITGMGVGEDFAGPGWEDRSLLLRGRAALTVKQEAVRQLLGQGVKPAGIPFWLRPSTRPVAVRTPPPTFQMGAVRAMQIHNEQGYGDKRATVTKAMIYSLLPAGSVAKVPDSLWNNPLWASLLVGHALRGGRVLIMAPFVENAPAPQAAAMSLAEDVLARVIVARTILGPAIDTAGGLLRVGIYSVDFSVDDIPRLIETVLANRARTPWVQQLEPFAPEVLDSMRAVAASLRASGFRATVETQPGEHPKLHMKAQFFASPDGWDDLFRDPGWGAVMAAYFRATAQIAQERPQYAEFYRIPPAPSAPAARAAEGASIRRQVVANRPERVLYYLLQGSHNEDYRSALLDGEALVLLSHFGASVGVADFVLLPTLCTWVDTVDELHRFLPRRHALVRRFAHWARIMF